MTQPAPQPAAPAADRTMVPMILGILASVLMLLGAMFFDWLSGFESKGTEASISIFWSTDTAGEASFFSSAGFVMLVIAAITLIAAALRRWGWVMYGAILAVLAFALVIVTFYRLEGDPGLGIGDAGLGLWMILAGGILAIVAGVMGRRPTV
jgi:hypothetical protein